MEFGIVIFPTEYTIPPSVLAKEAESRGFESLFFPEHTHIPASRLSPYPSGGDLPTEYSHTLDPFVALSAAQAVTTTLKIATGVALVIERDPIILAKEVASLDHLSEGRFLFGIGGGWNREEMANHGVDPRTRMALLEDRVAAMKAIWRNDEASYAGSFTSFEKVWSWPKPVQKPHPPILLGGNSEQALARAARIADEWMPIPARQQGTVKEIVSRFKIACEKQDREMLPISFYGAERNLRYLAEMEAAGVHRAIFWIASEDTSKTLATLDQLRDLVEQLS